MLYSMDSRPGITRRCSMTHMFWDTFGVLAWSTLSEDEGQRTDGVHSQQHPEIKWSSLHWTPTCDSSNESDFSRQPNVIKRTGMTQLTQDCERSDLQIHPLAGSISEPMLEWTQTCLHHYCSFYSVGSSSPLIKTYVFIQIYWVDTNNLLLIFSLHFSLDLPALVFCLCLFLRVRLLFRFELFSFDTLIKSNCSSAERSLTMLRIQNEQVCKVWKPFMRLRNDIGIFDTLVGLLRQYYFPRWSSTIFYRLATWQNNPSVGHRSRASKHTHHEAWPPWRSYFLDAAQGVRSAGG